MLRCNLKRRGGLQKKTKRCTEDWFCLVCSEEVKVVKYGFNVWNANSGLMKLAHLVKKATFVIIVDLTFFSA